MLLGIRSFAVATHLEIHKVYTHNLPKIYPATKSLESVLTG
ncbi:hypothetical protein [Photorhabdus australis]